MRNSNDDAPANFDNRDSFLEISPYESDGGELIGRHPDVISQEDWLEGRDEFPIGLSAIRANCLDCASSASEVRKCVHSSCLFWPLRMGRIPKAYKKARMSRISSRKSSAGGLGSERVEPVGKPAHEAGFEPEGGE